MNKNLMLFFIGTKIQSFAAALYGFGFLIIFYQMTHSLIYCSTLSAATIISSRAVMLYIVPKLKGQPPIKISILMNIAMGICAFIAIFAYSLYGKSIYFYFALAVVFAILEEIDNSFQYPVIPSIVKGDYLFKANSLNAMFVNINMVVSPLGSYLFYRYSDLRGLLLIFGLICIISSWILSRIEITFEKNKIENDEKKKKKSIITEWVATFKMIIKSNDISFCIAIGLAINLVFSGIFGPVLLMMGSMMPDEALGQSLLKILISIGSLLGVYGVYKLNVKKNYNRYVNISITGLTITLLILTFSNSFLLTYSGFLVMAVFIMFIMNSTGTFLQMSAPKEELPAIYAFRSTLIAGIVPLSHIIAAVILQYFDKMYYFLFSCTLITIIVLLKRFRQGYLNQNVMADSEVL